MSYQCPNQTCGHTEFIPIARVVVPSKWFALFGWTKVVGIRGRCARCLTLLCISREKGVYRVVEPRGPSESQIEALLRDGPPRDRNEAAAAVRGLFADANFPSEPGV